MEFIGFCWKGKREGQGKMTYNDSGSIYEGTWKNDKRVGEGRLIFQNGDVYDGGWKNDRREGKGRVTLPNGDIFEGEWINDERKLHGELKFCDGGKHVGEIIRDFEMQGKGKGVSTYTNGDFYDGYWREGLKEGFGTYTWADGNSYVGSCKRGDRDGDGKIMYSGGLILEGRWAKNRLEYLVRSEVNMGQNENEASFEEKMKYFVDEMKKVDRFGELRKKMKKIVVTSENSGSLGFFACDQGRNNDGH